MRETCCECCLFVWKSSRNMLEAETILIAGSKNKLFVVLLCGTQLLEQFHGFGQSQYQRSPILIVIKIVVTHGRPLSHVVASLLACHLTKTTPRGNCGLPKFDRERCRHACAVHRIENETQSYACLKRRSHRQRQKQTVKSKQTNDFTQPSFSLSIVFNLSFIYVVVQQYKIIHCQTY